MLDAASFARGVNRIPGPEKDVLHVRLRGRRARSMKRLIRFIRLVCGAGIRNAWRLSRYPEPIPFD